MKHCVQDAPCPCGKQITKARPACYGACCGRWLDSTAPAEDALALMRSRYSAFVLERDVYLLETWHVSTRPATLEFDPRTRWLGLEIRRHTVQDADHAEVEFVARQRPQEGPAIRLHEVSRFVCEGGRWVYVDGVLK